MNIETLLYLINVIDNIDCFIAIIFFTLLIYTIISIGIAYNKLLYCRHDEEFIFNEKIKRNIKLMFMSFALLLLSCFLPSEKTMYLMLSTKYLKYTVIPEKVITIVNNKLDKYIENKE